MTIQIIHETAKIELMNSSKIASELIALIKKSLQYDIIEDNLKKLNSEIKKSIEKKYKSVIERLATKIKDKEKRLVDISILTG